MKRRNQSLLFSALLAALLPLVQTFARAPRSEQERWTSVRSQNFRVLGRAREKDLRRLAARLEEYRAAFTRLLPEAYFDPTVPTTVVVFRDDDAYKPFKPIIRGQTASYVAGYFQPGSEVNYITLSLDSDAGRGSPSTLLHEYTHVLVNNYFRNAPLWLKEGLAEFYSTARISDDRRRVTLGGQIPLRVRQLRAAPLIPLRTLFAVDQSSPFYFEPDKRGLFYAESWALVHYILEEDAQSRRAQLAHYVELLSSGAAADESFVQAFRESFEEFESGLAAYARRAEFPVSVEEFDRPLESDSELEARPMSEAEGLALLGDLLLHTDRTEEAEGYLLRALELDATQTQALVSLGVLRLRQNRFAEARERLERAVAAEPQNYLAHFQLADALYREGSSETADKLSVEEFEHRTEAIRAELRRASELAPNFVEAYRLLASVEIERADRPAVAEALIKRAISLSPRRADLVLLLAQARLAEGDFDAARRLTEQVARGGGGDPRLSELASTIEARINAREELVVRLKSQADEAAKLEASSPAQPCDMPSQGGPQKKPLRFEGQQACGRLVEIECPGDFVVLRVESGAHTLRLATPDLRGVRFVTYTTAVKTGHLTCGLREPANAVLVTFKPKRDDKTDTDGEAVAVEFIPDDWNR